MADELDKGREFERWFTESWPGLVRALGAWCGDIGDGAEAAAEACARAYAQWSRVGRMDSPSGWAFRVGQTQLRRNFRRHGRESGLGRGVGADAVSAKTSGGGTATEIVEREHLLAALQLLPPRQREAVLLRYVLDMTQEQVAEQMSMAPGTAAATLHAARRNLRERLGDEEEARRVER